MNRFLILILVVLLCVLGAAAVIIPEWTEPGDTGTSDFALNGGPGVEADGMLPPPQAHGPLNDMKSTNTRGMEDWVNPIGPQLQAGASIDEIVVAMIRASSLGNADRAMALSEQLSAMGPLAGEKCTTVWYEVCDGKHSEHVNVLAGALSNVLYKTCRETDMFHLATVRLRRKWVIVEGTKNADSASVNLPEYSLLKGIDRVETYVLLNWVGFTDGSFPGPLFEFVKGYSAGQFPAETPSVWISELFRVAAQRGWRKAAEPAARVLLGGAATSERLQRQLALMYLESPTGVYELLDKAAATDQELLQVQIARFLAKNGLNPHEVEVLGVGIADAIGSIPGRGVMHEALISAASDHTTRAEIGLACDSLLQSWLSGPPDSPAGDAVLFMIGSLSVGAELQGKSNFDSGISGPLLSALSDEQRSELQRRIGRGFGPNAARGRAEGLKSRVRVDAVLRLLSESPIGVDDSCRLIAMVLEESKCWSPRSFAIVADRLVNTYSPALLSQSGKAIAGLLDVVLSRSPAQWQERLKEAAIEGQLESDLARMVGASLRLLAASRVSVDSLGNARRLVSEIPAFVKVKTSNPPPVPKPMGPGGESPADPGDVESMRLALLGVGITWSSR